MATIQGIYIALFGRPADPLGLQFFNQATNNGANLTAIGDLAASAEYQDRFEGMSNVQIVNSIYQSLFGRDADLAGLTFFTAALQNGTYNINNIAIAILDGAQGDDLATVNNKIEAANLFTASLDTGAEVVAYQGEGAAEQGRAFLAGITEDEATVPTQTQVDAAIAAIVADPNAGGPGDTFTLTNATNAISGGVDTITGSSGDDNFRAILAESLDSTDTLDGGAGFDTLNISANGINTDANNNAPILRNIERINNADSATALNLANAVGVQQVWTTGVAGNYDNASLATVFGASGSVNTNIDIDYAGTFAGTTTAQLAVAMTGGATADFDFDDAASIEAVSINAVSGNSTVDLDGALDLEAVSVTGAGRVTVVTTGEAGLETFDASGNTGGVTYVSNAVTGDVTVTGGSGNDVLNFGNGTAASSITINAGAGNDSVTGGAGDDTIDLGAGNDLYNGSLGEDTITLGAGNDVAIYTAGAQSTIGSMDVITDFNVSGNDTLDVSAFGVALATAADLISAQSAVDALAEGSTITDAVNAAFGASFAGAGNELVYFTFEENTYAAIDVNADGNFDANEFVVELTGSVALTASDFTL